MFINIIEYLEKVTLKNNAEKTAVIDENSEMDFLTLTKEAKKVATIIFSTKDFINRPIAVFLPKGVQSVIANLGITTVVIFI